MACAGTAEDHCCYIGGKVCKFLRDDGLEAERRWVCVLFDELGDWGRVHSDRRYVASVQPFWDRYPVRGLGCGDYPYAGKTCATCGVTGG